MPQSPEKVDLRRLLYAVNLELLALLNALTAEQWLQPTVCGSWTVKDVAAHLWGGDVGRLAGGRDGFFRPNVPINTYADLVAWIDQQNASWVAASQRISPKLLLGLMAQSNEQLYHYWRGCDLDAASIGVAWAGEATSPLWFDIGREYTEKWMHQQHIREAVGAPGLTQRRWMHPVLNIFMRGMPHAYRNVDAPDGTNIGVEIQGDAGGNWLLLRDEGRWLLAVEENDRADVRIALSQDIAWRLFTSGISAEEAMPHVQIDGHVQLGLPLLSFIAIMA